MVLDSGIYKTPIPEWGYVGYDEWGVSHKFTYKYYLKDSIAYRLQQFFFGTDSMEEAYSKRRFDKVILYYENAEEKEAFEFYVENKQKVVEQYVVDAEKDYYLIDAGNEKAKRIEKHRLSIGLALNKLLQEFRELR